MKVKREMILFITRKYPPSIGGMEKMSYYLTTTIARRRPATIIKWGHSQRWLPIFVLYAFMRALVVLAVRKIELVHLSDAVLAPMGLLLQGISRRPVALTVHGLDIVYPNRLYQAVIPACVRRLAMVICVSEHTRQQCLVRGIRAERMTVIPNGIDADAFSIALAQDEQTYWLHRWGLEARPKHLLLVVGRLVPRKGTHFLVSQILPCLRACRSDWACLIVGDGPERQHVISAIEAQGLRRETRLLGQVPDEELRAAYALADLFLMPNVSVAGDVEGFGLVILEARAAGLPVIASSLEGIGDALVPAEDGLLLPPGNAVAFAQAISQWLDAGLTTEDRVRRQDQVRARYAWTHIGEEYEAALSRAVAQYSRSQG